MAREQLQTLSEPMYYILLSLIEPRHGYDIMTKVSELSKGRVVVGAGTLYTLLSRFEKEEIIYLYAEEKRRKIYLITQKGMNMLKDEYIRLKNMVTDGDFLFKK